MDVSKRVASAWMLDKCNLQIKSEGRTASTSFNLRFSWEISQVLMNHPQALENLGIPRTEMPVIESDRIMEFVKRIQQGLMPLSDLTQNHLNGGDRDSDKRRYRIVKLPVGHLKATQKELNPSKVRFFQGLARKKDTKMKPILISRDNFILDGHHRWAGYLLEDPTLKLSGIQVDMSVEELLAVANRFTDAYGIARKSV
jgi:hypothetical protein